MFSPNQIKLLAQVFGLTTLGLVYLFAQEKQKVAFREMKHDQAISVAQYAFRVSVLERWE
jgi:hypothetical protein